jgi:hypothetical protein
LTDSCYRLRPCSIRTHHHHTKSSVDRHTTDRRLACPFSFSLSNTLLSRSWCQVVGDCGRNECPCTLDICPSHLHPLSLSLSFSLLIKSEIDLQSDDLCLTDLRHKGRTWLLIKSNRWIKEKNTRSAKGQDVLATVQFRFFRVFCEPFTT